jgi:hypothetical protein
MTSASLARAKCCTTLEFERYPEPSVTMRVCQPPFAVRTRISEPTASRLDPVPVSFEAIHRPRGPTVRSSCVAAVAKQEVEAAVTVVVENRHHSSALFPVRAVSEGGTGEGAVAVVAEEQLSLSPVEALRADVHELSGAFVLPSTDPLEHVHSHVVGNLARGEAVLGEEIEASIVVVVEELPAPAPLTVAGAHLLRHVGESAPLVVQQRRSRARRSWSSRSSKVPSRRLR